MQHLTSLLLIGALGVSAHPSGHHGHARFHNRNNDAQERDIGDLIVATIDGAVVSWTQTANYGAAATPMIKSDPIANLNVAAAASTTLATSTVASTATASSSTAEATATASSSSSSSSGSGTGVTSYTSFTDYCATSASKRATLAQIAYAGNVGTTYGCNIMPVASEDVAAQYDNTAKFYGATSDMTCAVWNKIGVDGGTNGFFGVDATTFTLAAGATQYVAFDANSQGGAACFAGSDLTKTSYGSIAGTWLEFDFENTSNNNYSGADASCIVAQNALMSVPGLSVCNADDDTDCSNISADATTVLNAYTADLADADGIGIITSGPLKLNVNVGY